MKDDNDSNDIVAPSVLHYSVKIAKIRRKSTIGMAEAFLVPENFGGNGNGNDNYNDNHMNRSASTDEPVPERQPNSSFTSRYMFVALQQVLIRNDSNDEREKLLQRTTSGVNAVNFVGSTEDASCFFR